MINNTSRKISETLKRKIGRVYIQETTPIENLVAKRRFLMRKGFGYAETFPAGKAVERGLVPFKTFCYKAKGRTYVSTMYIEKHRFIGLDRVRKIKTLCNKEALKNVCESKSNCTAANKAKEAFATGRIIGVIFYQD